VNKSSAVAEMGDRLATIDIRRKVGGAAVPFSLGELGPHLTNVPRPRLISIPRASLSIQLFGHNRYGPKIGGVRLLGGSWLPI